MGRKSHECEYVGEGKIQLRVLNDRKLNQNQCHQKKHQRSCGKGTFNPEVNERQTGVPSTLMCHARAPAGTPGCWVTGCELPHPLTTMCDFITKEG